MTKLFFEFIAIWAVVSVPVGIVAGKLMRGPREYDGRILPMRDDWGV